MQQKSVKGPLIKVCVFFALFFPLTLSLGFWQLDRAQEKAKMLEVQQERSSQPSMILNLQKLENYSNYTFRGEYQSQSYLLDNRTRGGKAGYELLTVLTVANGDSVLVNRGWLPAPRYRTEIPEIEIPKGAVALNVYYYLAKNETPVLKDDLGYQSIAWPKRVQSLDWEKIRRENQGSLVVGQFRLSDQQQPGAYLADWPSPSVTPSKHTGYAVQWFALSVALVLLSIFACWRIVKDARIDKSEVI
jgi:surfeit locus 1 family protein